MVVSTGPINYFTLGKPWDFTSSWRTALCILASWRPAVEAKLYWCKMDSKVQCTKNWLAVLASTKAVQQCWMATFAWCPGVPSSIHIAETHLLALQIKAVGATFNCVAHDVIYHSHLVVHASCCCPVAAGEDTSPARVQEQNVAPCRCMQVLHVHACSPMHQTTCINWHSVLSTES